MESKKKGKKLSKRDKEKMEEYLDKRAVKEEIVDKKEQEVN